MKRTSIKILYLMLIGLFFMLQFGSGFAAGQTIEDPAIGEKGYHVGSYGGGAYWVTNGLYNSMFIVSAEGVIVVDAPPSYADKIPTAIKEVTDLPVKYFVYSHHHKDHTGGSAVFGDEVIRVGHELTAQELRRKADPNRPVPTVTFSDTYTLELGNQRPDRLPIRPSLITWLWPGPFRSPLKNSFKSSGLKNCAKRWTTVTPGTL